jgi:hypothetical protein
MPTVQMYRCTTCGKWSHAKRQPRSHKRWVREDEPGYDPERALSQAWYDDSPSGHLVDCGPFVPYVATPGRLS